MSGPAATRDSEISYPRGEGATMGRIIDEETGRVVSAEIISLSSLEVLYS